MSNRVFLAKATAPLVLTSLLLLALGVGAAVGVDDVQRTSSDRVASRVTNIREAEELEIGLRELRTYLRLYRLTRDPVDLRPVETQRAALAMRLDRLQTSTIDPLGVDALARVAQGFRQLSATLDELDRALPEAWGAIVARGDDVLTHECLPASHEYLERAEALAEEAVAANQRAARRVSVYLLIAGIAGAAVGLLGRHFVSRQLRHSFAQLREPIEDVAGRLNRVTGPIPMPAETDISGVGRAMGRIATEVDAILARLETREREVLRVEQMARVGQLTAGMAHEIRNPLMAIRILVEGYLEQGEPLPTDDLRVIYRQVERLEGLVQRLLDYVRPQKPVRQLLKLDELVAHTLELVQPRARKLGIAVRLARPNGAAPILGDGGQLEQIVLNLAMNALDATPAGGVVDVAVRTADGYTELVIRDTGPGIRNDILTRLFEPFISSKETGLGLGLAVSQRIAEDHGGTLTAHNLSGGGACFTLRLPAIDRNTQNEVNTCNTNTVDYR